MARTLKVPSTADIAKKWGDVTPGKSTYYENATKNAGGTWEANTTAAKNTFKLAVSAAGIENRFAGGVKGKAGKFERKVVDVGIGRFGPGVSAAVTDMEDAFGPYRDLLDGMSIPDRGPRGDPGNYAIVQKVGDPLHKKRLSLLGAASK